MERIFRLSAEHGIDSSFHLFYGHQMEHKLLPCSEILDQDLHIGVIGNNTVKPDRLRLLEKDRGKIQVTIPQTGEVVELLFPGKSGIIILNPDGCGKSEVSDIVQNDMNAVFDRRDHLHVATCLRY